MSYKIFRFVSSLFLAIIVSVSSWNIQPAHAVGPWYVASTGDDNNDCLSPTTPCFTINGTIGKAASGDTIYVAIGSYTAANADIAVIDKDLSILGGWDATFITQSGASTLEGSGAWHGIIVNSGVTAIVERFVIQNAAVGFGSGLFNLGTLTLNNSTVNHNNSSDGGGGIYNVGTLTLNDSSVNDNVAGLTGGGGIYNSGGTLTLNNSSVINNISSGGSGGIYNFGGLLNLNNSVVSGNTSQFNGGGILSNGTANLSNSIITANKSQNTNGGGISNGNTGVLTLINSNVSNNISAGFGGGIFNDAGVVALTDSIISNNLATTGSGGGIENRDFGTLTVTNTTISDNTAAGAGGIANLCIGNAKLINSTISGNTSTLYDGGGITNCGTLALNSTTISGNTANDRGGGISNFGPLTLINSILAGNNDLSSQAPDCWGAALDSQGYNLVQNDLGCIITGDFTGNLIGVNPVLGPLQDNGGQTITHALLPGSPAIDAGNPVGCTDQNGNLLTTDQRGIARPQGTRCDIGAFELEAGGGGGTEVTIDIKPGSQTNPINMKSSGKIPVAILSSPDFNAVTEIDRTSLTFGSTGNEHSLVLCNKGGTDVNGDGLKDLVCHFKTKLTGFKSGDIEGILKGLTLTGVPIEARDVVKVLQASYP